MQTKISSKPCYWLCEQILLLRKKNVNYKLIHLLFHTLIVMKEAQDESLATENIHPFSSIVKRWIEKVQLIKNNFEFSCFYKSTHLALKVDNCFLLQKMSSVQRTRPASHMKDDSRGRN